MRKTHTSVLVILSALLVFMFAAAQDVSRPVAGGGISIPGWSGKIDASRENTGLTINDAKLAKEGDAMHVTTGPAVAYWNPANSAQGNYTVKATFKEPKFMNLNDHPHPYGIFIAGNDMGTDKQTYLYCAAYGDGRFIVRGFGPAAFRLNERGTPSDSVHKAPAKGEAVTQEIALSVNSDKIECAINGSVVATYDKSSAVGEGKLKSTDGVYGIRFGHNTEGLVTGLTVAK